ncbi:MAG TPA: hypothetical protein DDX19_00415 [Rhodopirellula baltica]|uniref:Uncharacterized protein n=1 Tax=Rhodopirellula baltica (strain DSM 10527 / NCIMB 13988 / SH1) TaxID=243090 RepID=Q7URR3_RHOBA|nr:hypothetical protein [Rhodopirellula baltica]CAD74275.1 hypothetical protein RB5501 [Rhodopirellula baltica SH 1]HBE61241.1 hypothetical protein [Rhodopirellula baltica]
MSATNRAKLITKLQTALKKHYDVAPATPSRPLLEHALYACLLEDCPADLADEGLAKLEQDYFDWNEVRVTTVTELAAVLSSLPDPNKAAQRLKSILQAIFEEFYSFDLDHLKKENLGKAVAKFEGMSSMTPFVLSYIIQHGLGGHSIPIDYSAMVVMLVTGIASQAEASDGRVPGLERAVPKSKGVEFAALMHQPAVALLMDPKDKNARTFLESVAKGSSKELDEWLTSKEAAIKRVKARKKEEREAAKQEAEAEAAEEAEAKSAVLVKRSAKKGSRVTKSSVQQKSAAEQAAESQARLAAEAKKAEAKAAASSKSTKKKATTDKSSSTAKSSTSGTAKKSSKTSASKTASKSTETTRSAGEKSSKTSTTKKAPAKKSGSNAKPSSSAKEAAPKKSAKKKSTTTSKSASTDSSSSAAGKKATNRKLTKRKPR